MAEYPEDDPLRDNARCTAQSPTLIELVPVVINYDMTVEKMMADYHPFEYMMQECADEPIGYAADYFPGCKEGRIGKQTRELLLFRPVPDGEYWGLSQIQAAIDKAGYVAEELPSLAALFPFADSLWDLFGNKIGFIHAVGPHSIWQPPDGAIIATFLYTGDGETHPWNWARDLDRAKESDWFVVSRKTTDDK